jgi:hypothetical protein
MNKKAVRVMKSRRRGLLSCGCWTEVGRLIVKRDQFWICIEHDAARRGQTKLF